MGLAGIVLAGCGQASAESFASPAFTAANPANRVVVLYLHRTYRCIRCEWIENNTRQALKDRFSSELASGRLVFQVAEYGSRPDLAKRYDGQTASVAVIHVADGREVAYQDLDKVWELRGDSEKFRAYIAEAVRAALRTTK
jgi:hypothetical protein